VVSTGNSSAGKCCFLSAEILVRYPHAIENVKAEFPAAKPSELSQPSRLEISTRPTAGERLLSLDAYRGAIMLLMASSGLGLGEVAKHFPDSAWWKFLGTQTDHAAWAGCTLWDMPPSWNGCWSCWFFGSSCYGCTGRRFT